MKKFDFDNKGLQNQFDSIEWIENSGLGEEELLSEFNALMKRDLRCTATFLNADDLRAAQKDPERYATLQVRVCGWNAYFVNLTKEEQNSFIKQAEGAV